MDNKDIHYNEVVETNKDLDGVSKDTKNSSSFMLFDGDISEEELIIMDIFDINKDLDAIVINPDYVNLEDINDMIITKLSSMCFNIQSMGLSINDSMRIKDAIEYIYERIINQEGFDVDEILNIEFNNKVDIESSKSKDELLYLIEIYERLFYIYNNHSQILFKRANDYAYEVVELLDAKLISEDDLEVIFNENLDITLRLKDKCRSFERLEMFMLKEIKRIEDYNKITLEDINSEITKVNDIIRDVKENVRVDLIIIKNNGIKGERVRYNNSIKDHPISDYILHYLLVERLNDDDFVRISYSISNYDEYLRFINEMKSIKRSV